MSVAQLLSIEVPLSIENDDCVYCFENMKNRTKDDGHSLHICLTCFQCFCEDHWALHQEVVVHEHGCTHDLSLKVSKVLKPEEKPSSPPLEKKLKLEVKDVNEDDLYDTYWSLQSLENGELLSAVSENVPSDIMAVINKILNAKSASFQDLSNTWTLEIRPCKHVESFDVSKLTKADNFSLSSSCNTCGLESNLWLCLHCGNVGCGRQQIGIEGHSHALKHYEETENHCLAVKLGSLAKGTSDVYCYACDEDVRFTDHGKWESILKFWGIDLSNKQADEKTLIELQVEQSMKWDFKMVDSKGHELQSLPNDLRYGVGLLNLGNTCYLNSVIQILLNGGVKNWNLDSLGDFPSDVIYPRNNLKCQLIKLRNGMKQDATKYSGGIKPTSFKKVVGGSHEEFSTGRQQDAMEFFSYLSDKLDRDVFAKLDGSPNDAFRFKMQDKFKCSKCNQVKLVDQVTEFIQIPLIRMEESQTIEDRLRDYFAEELIEFHCPTCKEVTLATKTTGFVTLPQTLILNPTRTEIINWQPSKTSDQLVVPGIRNDAVLDITCYSAKGKLEDEIEFAEEGSESFSFNESALVQLKEMGFSEGAAKRALYASNNTDSETAMNWLLQHLDDPDLNDDFVPPSNAQGAEKVDNTSLDDMIAMGLDPKLCRKALLLNNGNVPLSVEWVFSNMDDDGEIAGGNGVQPEKMYGINPFPNARYTLSAAICHKGNSVHSGHYVAFIKKNVDGKDQWVLYNDEKILLANAESSMDEIERNGYIFLFQLQI